MHILCPECRKLRPFNTAPCPSCGAPLPPWLHPGKPDERLSQQEPPPVKGEERIGESRLTAEELVNTPLPAWLREDEPEKPLARLESSFAEANNLVKIPDWLREATRDVEIPYWLREVEPDEPLALPPLAALTPAPQRARPRVFVSHSHKNDEFTARFVADLRDAGVEVWVDMVNMQHGDFMTRISEALSTCEWLVLVLTPEALASPAVQHEVNAAINRYWHKRMKGIIPLMAQPCNPEEIPAMWDNFHRYDATSDYTSALAGLLRALGIERA
ncbi:MAG TPA: toll/interleukin-1 receptor domain-containing protein [Ktedonobacterales bacterium]|nr:toll/interleukin-1 receptor domain-containing protein [Ktedonobacterales bacterium]